MTTSGQVRHTHVAWRIFVHGVDVSDDVTSLTINWTDERAPSVAQITLSSLDDKYITTDADIAAMYDDIDLDNATSSELQALQAMKVLDRVQGTANSSLEMTQSNSTSLSSSVEKKINKSVAERLLGKVTNPVKRRVLLSKYAERFNAKTQPALSDTQALDLNTSAATQGKTSLLEYASLQGDCLRFPFQVGQCIFHTGDAVRIFVRDPYDTKAWYFAGTGSVTDWQEDVDEDGGRLVTLSMMDSLRMYLYSRVVTNWALFDVDVLEAEGDARFRTWQVDNFDDLTLPEILYLLTFGASVAGDKALEKYVISAGDTTNPGYKENIKGVDSFDYAHYGVNGKTSTKASFEGVGAFNFEDSRIFVLGPELKAKADELAPNFVGPASKETNEWQTERVGDKLFERVQNLEEWQSAIDHRVRASLSDILSLVVPTIEARGEVTNYLLDLQTRNDGLLDVEEVIDYIGQNPQLFPVDHGRLMMLLPSTLGPGTNRDILLRDLVSGIAATTEYSKRLELIYGICERLDFSFYATPRGDIVCEMPLYSFKPTDFGAYAERYIFPMEDICRWNSHFEENRVRTQFRMPWQIVRNIKSIGNSDQVWQVPGVITLKALVPNFGVRMEHGDPYGFISSPEAATYYANIKLTQMNANAWRQNIQTTMHLGVGPNRPCYFESRDFIATLRNVSSSIVWDESIQQSLTVNYRRGWSGQLTLSENTRSGAQRTHVYESFGGQASQTVNYSMLFQERSNEGGESTKSLSNAQANTKSHETLSAAQIERNRVYVQEKVIDPFIKALAVPGLRSEDLIGDTVRSEFQNFLARGKENSKHLDGLAFDIPLSKMKNAGLTPDTVLEKLRDVKSTEGVPTFRIVNELDGTTGTGPHIHVQLKTGPSIQQSYVKR